MSVAGEIVSREDEHRRDQKARKGFRFREMLEWSFIGEVL